MLKVTAKKINRFTHGFNGCLDCGFFTHLFRICLYKNNTDTEKKKEKKTRKSILSYSIYVSNGIICCVNCFSNNQSDRVFAGILNTLPMKVRRLFKE